jgi:hypothetical protein
MRYEKKDFRNCEVVLDGNEFVHCTIEGCTLVFSGGTVTAVGTTIANVTYDFRGPAVQTAAYLASIRTRDPQGFENIMQAAIRFSLGQTAGPQKN